MFDGVKSFVKRMVRRMFPVGTVQNIIGDKVAISQAMIEKIDLWQSMNTGSAPWVCDTIQSLRIENGITREFSNIVLSEMDTTVSHERLDRIYQHAIKDLNENLQSGIALGSFVIKPLGGYEVEYITANNFIPINFNSDGRLTDVVFIERKMITNEKYYIRFERHKLIKESKTLVITNQAYFSSDGTTIGRQIELTDVEEWATLPDEIMYQGVERPDFGYYRNPIKNDIDGSFCGVSVFDSAIDQIKKADTQFSRLDWEFESGERIIHVDNSALIPQQAHSVFDKVRDRLPRLNKRLYRGLNLNVGGDQELYKEYSPQFRDENIINGLNSFLRRIEFNVSLAYGDLSDAEYVEKTATEIKTAKIRKYNMVNAIESNLKDCLEDLVYALAFYNAMTKTGYEFVCNFNDSILTDEESEREQDRLDVSMGVMPVWEYRMKWYNETEEEAKRNLPDNADIVV